MSNVVRLVVPEAKVKSEIERRMLLMKAAPELAEAMLDILAETAESAAMVDGAPNLAMRVQRLVAKALAATGAPARDCSICRRSHGAEVQHERE